MPSHSAPPRWLMAVLMLCVTALLMGFTFSVAWTPRVGPAVAKAVAEAARRSGVARI